MRGSFYSTPLRAGFATFLALHGRCAACNQPVPAELSACACSLDAHDVLDLRLTGVDQEEFDRRLSAEIDLYCKSTRIAAGKPEQKPLTEDEIKLLVKLQDGLCWYCADKLPLGRDGPTFDCDHYVPVERGGKTTLENTVLACPRCDRSKGKDDGYEYELKMRHARKPELKLRYAVMRRQFRLAMRKLGRNHIACDGNRAALVLRRPSS